MMILNGSRIIYLFVYTFCYVRLLSGRRGVAAVETIHTRSSTTTQSHRADERNFSTFQRTVYRNAFVSADRKSSSGCGDRRARADRQSRLRRTRRKREKRESPRIRRVRFVAASARTVPNRRARIRRRGDDHLLRRSRLSFHPSLSQNTRLLHRNGRKVVPPRDRPVRAIFDRDLARPTARVVVLTGLVATRGDTSYTSCGR